MATYPDDILEHEDRPLVGDALDLGDEDELEIKGQVGFEGGAGNKGPVVWSQPL